MTRPRFRVCASVFNLMEILIFAAKILIVVLGISSVLVVIAFLAAKAQQKPELEIENLNQRFKNFSQFIKLSSLSDKELKADAKKIKQEEKEESLTEKSKPRLFVLDFKGDVKAQAVDHLKEEVSAVLSAFTEKDKVLVRLESPGGMVMGYGLGASQLHRLREKQIPLTVSVDKVAASGGYMMACVANTILCAPFGAVGSIGVVAQVPNFNKLLKKHDVDYKEYTAGEFKRTVSIFGEITPKGEEKFLEQLEDTHKLFKNFVGKFRPQLDLAKVATGEYWYGDQAISLQLVDRICTSDDYIMEHLGSHQILKISFKQKQKLSEKISEVLGQAFQKAGSSLFSELESRRLP